MHPCTLRFFAGGGAGPTRSPSSSPAASPGPGGGGPARSPSSPSSSAQCGPVTSCIRLQRRHCRRQRASVTTSGACLTCDGVQARDASILSPVALDPAVAGGVHHAESVPLLHGLPPQDPNGKDATDSTVRRHCTILSQGSQVLLRQRTVLVAALCRKTGSGCSNLSLARQYMLH